MSAARGLSLTSPLLRPAPARPPQRHGRSGVQTRRCFLVARAQMRDEQPPQLLPQLLPRLQSAAVAVAAAAWLTLGGPAAAELQTVPISQATQMAKPLQQQPVNKERIWLLLVLGGTALFGTTVVFENNATLFPAITKANKAMAAAKKMPKDEQESGSSGAVDVAYEQAAQQRLIAVEAEREWDAKAEEAVLAGLQQAKQAVLEAPAAAADAAPAAAPAAEPVTPAPATAAAAPAPAAAAEEEAAAPQTEVAAKEAAAAAPAAAPAESRYPPIIFEPGSIKPPGTVAAKLQGMSDADLEEALRRRQWEMEQQAQQILQEQQAQKAQQAAQELVQEMSDEELEEALRRRQREMGQQAQAAQVQGPQQQQ